jgi:hypothetical protein
MPLVTRRASALLTSPIGETAAVAATLAARCRARVGAASRDTTVSTSVFHAWHEGHCPAQRNDSEPHCWQT